MGLLEEVGLLEVGLLEEVGLGVGVLEVGLLEEEVGPGARLVHLLLQATSALLQPSIFRIIGLPFGGV